MTNSLLHINEPRLSFGYGQELENPKDGLFLFGPLDDRANPAEIRIGVIGTPQGLDCFDEWVESIQGFIPPKDPNRPHHAGWPGFQGVFGTRWPKQPLVKLTVSENALHNSIRIADRHEAIYETVNLFSEPIRKYLRQDEAPPTMWFVVITGRASSLWKTQINRTKGRAYSGKSAFFRQDRARYPSQRFSFS